MSPERLHDGREALCYTLESASGMRMVCTNYGCRILALWAPDRRGELGDVVLGHRSLREYGPEDYYGAFVGRYANRIGNAKFSLNGEEITLAKNDGGNSLHGGPGGFHQALFSALEEEGEEPSILFTYTSPDGDEGYPGEMKLSVRYTLTAENTLRVEYAAKADRETVFNPTNHSFFNLSADPQRTVLDTVLTLNASRVTAVSSELIPTGQLADVAGGPMDFTTGKAIGKDLAGEDSVLRREGGYDHNFCVDGEGFRQMAVTFEPASGRVMEVWSDLPGVQLYTCNRVKGELGKDGLPIPAHSAFCLETQFYPDSPNHPNFPFGTVCPGEEFRSRTEYRFSVR